MDASTTILVGTAGDGVLSSLAELLAERNKKVLWVTDLAEVQISVPICHTDGKFRLKKGSEILTLNGSDTLIFTNYYIGDLEDQSDSAYRRAETFASWFTFMTLFQGRAINRPHTLTPPLYSDPLLARIVARALGIPTVADLVRGPGNSDVAEGLHAQTDLASGVSLWSSSAADLGRRIVSHIDYSPDAQHYIVVRLPGETQLLSYSSIDGCRSEHQGSAEAVIKSAEGVCEALGLEYAYLTFIQHHEGWQFTKLFMDPPPVFDENVLSSITLQLANCLDHE